MKDDSMVAYNQPALQQKNTDSFYYPTRSALGITKHRRADVAWLFTDTAQQWPYAFQERPILAKGTKSDPSLPILKPWINGNGGKCVPPLGAGRFW
ncbi:hypothetical protein [Paraflavitalea speifideaquila]|uniref:hypothetical protein n=1 Tax=Paraflavitalea speifideaquila TaxID=3076558 RepID=UPI0028EFB50C|nr:hypothetical protein [Paraflavitalea speifideiaquila]